uniref:non-specific serine/threonine protein kinase n=1 Tax=Drosophila melanogaster TaxID=7227 RepID=Q7YU14_DROME|nr:LD22885p [Drosophila melanogaster]
MADEKAKESFRERQAQELEVIKSIFGCDVEDLRPQANPSLWKPTDIRIQLTPLRDSSNGLETYVCTKLHVTCPSKYPKLPPKISLEESKGMSDQLLEALRNQLQAQSQELRGEVMIYELAQTVQAFLLEHNKPPKGSFYDQMLQDKQKRDQELQDLPALGALVESLMPTNSYEMRDFVDKCNSDRTLSASELLEHPFLRFYVDNGQQQVMPLPQQQHPNTVQRTGSAMPYQIPTLALSQSRLRTEFEVLMYLGKGAFGDVLKVRNILDNREYAIKRIPLPARSRQLYKKMTREVELLSRLNHENVVRYFNSWIESVDDADAAEMDKLLGGEWSQSQQDLSVKPAKSPQLGPTLEEDEDEEDSSSSMWNGYIPNMEDSDSDGIEFVDSNGKVAVYDDEEQEDSTRGKTNSPKPLMQVMYIQMEFCEKCTLRTAIDDNLFNDTDRLWRLFREIAEGLAHIHQQGIIHRDLKPVNIFLDSHDQIKIGDFGLATTSFLALQAHDAAPAPVNQITSAEDGTGTGKVGTTLYVAPELTGNASKSVYNQKVDMYTLGIILFEMCQPPFDTSMERAQTIMALRNVSINIPDAMLKDPKYEKTVKMLQWLLNHDPAQRPTAEELLISDLVPPAQLEANELQEMLRHALANPQSKAYKNLVARCLQQESDEVLEHTYHLGSSRAMKSWNSAIIIDDIVSLNPVIEFVKAKVVNLFRKHGAIEVDSPLLSPLSARNSTANANANAVHLMTHSGCVVVLPCDLRTQFARHVTMNSVNLIRRYCVDRVYREERVFNFHPKQSYDCSFDIIAPTTGSHLVDAELLSLAFEITSELPRLREKNLAIRMNHTNLLRAILIFCNVPKAQYGALFEGTMDFIESRISRFQFHSSITGIMEKSRTSAQTLMDMLLANFLLTGSRSTVDDSALKSLMRGKGEAASLARGALRELETVVGLAYSLGVKCPIHIWAGLPISFDRASNGGIVWQMTADLKPNRSGHPSVLAIGERYDSMLHEFQKQAQKFNPAMPARGVLSGAGLTFSLDKLVAAVGVEYAKDCRAIDVGICVCGTRPPLKDVTYIMRLLWSVGIRCGIVEAASELGDEAQDLARLGALHVILVAENGSLRVRSFERERFQERHLTRTELVEFIQKMLRSDGLNGTTVDNFSQLSALGSGDNRSSGGKERERGENGLSTSASNATIKNNYSQLPNLQVTFLTHDKPTANYKRRLENQVAQQMSSTLSQFLKKETFVVLVVELPPAVVNAIVGAINPREIRKRETEPEINYVIERFSKYKRYISEINEEVVDYLSDAKTPIVALYSISDSYYRVII